MFMRASALIIVAILLLPVFISAPAHALTLEKYERVETLYPYGPVDSPTNSVAIWAMDWSPDGQYLATSMWNSCPNATRITDMNTGNTLFSNAISYRDLSFSPDGRYLAAAEYSYNNITIYESGNWSTVLDIDLALGRIASISWSPNSSYLACAGQDGAVVILESNDWKEVKNFTAGRNKDMIIAWSPDGGYLATGGECVGSSADNIKVWNTHNWQIEKTLHIDEVEFSWARVYSLSWSPDSSRLAAGLTSYLRSAQYSLDPLVYVWNTSTWTEEAHSVLDYKYSKAVISLAYTPDSNNIVVGLSTINSAVTVSTLILRADTLQKIQTVAEWEAWDTVDDCFLRYGFSVALSPDGTRLAVAGYAVEIDEKRPDYSPLYEYAILILSVAIIIVLFWKRRRKNVPDVELEEREAKDPIQWRFF